MAYTYLTYAQIRTEIANSLGDSGKVFWTDAEIKLYVLEALRTWQALTSYWRDRGVFNTVNAQAFYDIPSLVDKAGVKILGYTLTDQDLVSIIQAHLLEPISPTAWTGTEMFTLNDLTTAIERRRCQFLVETGCVITRSTQASGAPPVNQVAFDENIIDVRRVAFIDASNLYKQLWRDDEFAMNAFNPGWSLSPGLAKAYSVALTPALNLQLSPPSINAGTIELLSVKSPAALDPTAGVLLNVPDNYAWVIKWGALADLLSGSGQSRDSARADYCEKRWAQGIELARMMPTVLQAYVNNSPVQLMAVEDLDANSPGWQNVTGSPNVAAMAGTNLMALSKVPDAIYGMTADVVRNAIVPTADGDFIQVGREELDVIVNYALHLAIFKQQGTEFQESIGNYVADFFALAALKNSRLKANITFEDELTEKETREEALRPRRENQQQGA